jgi:hypothetical protein
MTSAVTIHASAVYTAAGALIFLGPSETGKSTIRRLLSAQAEPLADDKVRLTWQNGVWRVTSADGGRHKRLISEEQTAEPPRHIPLRAVVRLHQASAPALQPIDMLLTCRYLTDAYFEVQIHRPLDVEARQWAFAWLAQVARSVPGYHLHFDLSLRTLKAVCETFNL